MTGKQPARLTAHPAVRRAHKDPTPHPFSDQTTLPPAGAAASAGGGCWCGRCWVVAGQEAVLQGVGGLAALRRMLPCCCWVQGGMRCERYSGAGGWWCVRRRVFSYPGVRERESSGYRVAGSSGGRGCDVLAALRRVVVLACLVDSCGLHRASGADGRTVRLRGMKPLSQS